jgi:plasmid stabilization system protein ParE
MFDLKWSNTALDQLADVYVAATVDQRAQIAAAVVTLNARLRTEPLTVGESRVGGFRIGFAPWLAVLFHVSEADRNVHVVRVRPTRH